MQFHRQHYQQGFIHEHKGNIKFFGTEVGKVEKCSNKWQEAFERF
jgi:hypothetical protein